MRMAKSNCPKMLSGKKYDPIHSPPPLSMQRALGTGLKCTYDPCVQCSVRQEISRKNGIKKIRGDFQNNKVKI